MGANADTRNAEVVSPLCAPLADVDTGAILRPLCYQSNPSSLGSIAPENRRRKRNPFHQLNGGWPTNQTAAIYRPMILTDPQQLAAEIQGRHNRQAVIGVDGWTGVGKTCLAKVLANATGGRTFDLDAALERDRKCYVAALRIDEIRRALATSELLFVSGICLRQVLELAEVEADAHVYVKRMASWGWEDEDELMETIPEFAGSSGEGLGQEMRLYHLKWKPHLRSTFEFHRHG